MLEIRPLFHLGPVFREFNRLWLPIKLFTGSGSPTPFKKNKFTILWAIYLKTFIERSVLFTVKCVYKQTNGFDHYCASLITIMSDIVEVHCWFIKICRNNYFDILDFITVLIFNIFLLTLKLKIISYYLPTFLSTHNSPSHWNILVDVLCLHT